LFLVAVSDDNVSSMYVSDECAELSDCFVLLSALLCSAVDVLSLHCFDNMYTFGWFV
jgi:hypothetical protein